MANTIINAQDAHALLTYDAATGHLYWKPRTGPGRNRTEAKPTAGCTSDDGYVKVNVGGKLHRAHRIIWLMVTGSWPKNTIDHINQDRSDNRWANLRAATRGENQQNHPVRRDNKSGYKGVFWHTSISKWWAYINKNGKRVTIGYFTDKNDAIAARQRAEVELFTHSPLRG